MGDNNNNLSMDELINYNMWLEAYDNDLNNLFHMIVVRNKYIKNTQENYERFCMFTYNKSSGYITEFI